MPGQPERDLPAHPGSGWVPDSCTLAPAELPARLAEFDRIFAASLRQVTSISDQQSRWVFAATAGQSQAIADLLRKEESCCSFFTFAINASGPGTVTVDVTVPASRAQVLAELNRLAWAALTATAAARAGQAGSAR